VSRTERAQTVSEDRPLIALILAATLAAYASIALVVTHLWISGLAAPWVAFLLWRRHARARFAAYIFFSVIGFRGLVRGPWPLVVFAIAAIVLMQTPAARRAWPSLSADSKSPGRC